MRKISVLYIIDTFIELGGAERNLFEVVTRLNKDNFRPLVCALQASSLLIGNLRKEGVEAKNLNIKRIYDFKAFKEAIKLIKFIKKEKVKIVVTYHESSDFWGGLIAKLAGVEVIISSRRDMGYKLKKNHIIVYKLINPLFDKIITVSDAVKSIIFERENVLWHKMETIYNGVEFEKFSIDFDTDVIKKTWGIEKDVPVIGILATLRPIKGHKYFLEAASLILKEFPKARFLIIGWYNKNDNYYNELISLSRKLNIERNVIFTGGRQDIPGMLSIIDICVLSSINEGFPNAILEYMAAGKPVVATYAGGTREAIIDRETGILVPPGDYKALASAILELLENKSFAETMGKIARERAEEYFSIDTMMNNVETLYDELLYEKERQKIKVKLITIYNIRSSFVSGLKYIFSSFFYHSGLFNIIKKKNSLGKAIKILAYHRVSNDKFDPLGMNVSLSLFESQIRYIKRHYNPISLKELTKVVDGQSKMPDNPIVITFDDGYRDNYHNVFPILKKYDLPATFFLTVKAISERDMLWHDAVVEYLRMTSKTKVNICKQEYPIGSYNQKMIATRAIIWTARNMSNDHRSSFLQEIRRKLDVYGVVERRSAELLSWDEVRTMYIGGMDFGSHGMTHSLLTKLTQDELNLEIGQSKQILEEELQTSINLFSYPYGGNGDFNNDIIQAVKNNGYLAACTLIRGPVNYHTSLLELNRYCITPAMLNGPFGGFWRCRFETELSGIFDILLNQKFYGIWR